MRLGHQGEGYTALITMPECMLTSWVSRWACALKITPQNVYLGCVDWVGVLDEARRFMWGAQR